MSPSLSPSELAEMQSIRWFHRIQLNPAVQTPGECPHTAAEATHRFGLPADMSGKSVLDIGAWDGLFSFEAESRGAAVTAMDTDVAHGGNWGGTVGFNFAHRHLQSKVEFRPCSVHDLDPAVHGTFDYVFFFGVLYHLTNPIDALQRVAAMTRECALIETAYCDHPEGLKHAFWEFKHGHHGDPTNYWYPTIAGLAATLKFVGFQEANLLYTCDGRMTIRALKKLSYTQ